MQPFLKTVVKIIKTIFFEKWENVGRVWLIPRIFVNIACFADFETF